MLFLSTLMMFINIHEFKRQSFGVSAVAITILQAILVVFVSCSQELKIDGRKCLYKKKKKSLD